MTARQAARQMTDKCNIKLNIILAAAMLTVKKTHDNNKSICLMPNLLNTKIIALKLQIN